MAQKIKRLDKILNRDGGRCGIHSDGCGKIIDKEADKPDVDHIFPKAYFQTLPNAGRFREIWNCQPMCRACHLQKGRGQVIDTIGFRCRCHYLRLADDGARYVRYAERAGKRIVWRDACFLSGDIPEGGFLIRPAKSPTISKQGLDPEHPMVRRPRSAGYEHIGFSHEAGYEHGHIFHYIAPLQRMLFNATEAFRCCHFSVVAAELENFDNFRRTIGNEAIIREFYQAFEVYLGLYWSLWYCSRAGRDYGWDAIASVVDSVRKLPLDVIRTIRNAEAERRIMAGSYAIDSPTRDVYPMFMPKTKWVGGNINGDGSVARVDEGYVDRVAAAALYMLSCHLTYWDDIGVKWEVKHYYKKISDIA